MIQRCFNRNARRYEHYGGRGISVCERWRKFHLFLEDMGERPEGMTLDRIDVHKSYCKSNCRWATAKEQMQNQQRHSAPESPEMTALRERLYEEEGVNI